jgi:hypothetical protein
MEMRSPRHCLRYSREKNSYNICNVDTEFFTDDIFTMMHQNSHPRSNFDMFGDMELDDSMEDSEYEFF